MKRLLVRGSQVRERRQEGHVVLLREGRVRGEKVLTERADEVDDVVGEQAAVGEARRAGGVEDHPIWTEAELARVLVWAGLVADVEVAAVEPGADLLRTLRAQRACAQLRLRPSDVRDLRGGPHQDRRRGTEHVFERKFDHHGGDVLPDLRTADERIVSHAGEYVDVLLLRAAEPGGTEDRGPEIVERELKDDVGPYGFRFDDGPAELLVVGLI